MDKKPFSLDAKQILSEYKTNKTGLHPIEAKKRLQKYGENILKKDKPKSKLQMFLSQFKDLMLIILMIAGVVTAIVSICTRSYGDLIDVGIIFGIVILNAVIGYIQEHKAEDALASLRKMSQPFAKVFRDGNLIEVPTQNIVVGDIVAFEAGDIVCADCYLIEAFSLKVDESMLTGESIEVAKKADIKLDTDTALGDRINMVHSGGVIAYGRGLGVVTATGMDTELGKIASMLNKSEETKTPIQQKLQKFSKWLTYGILIIALVVFLINVFVKPGYDVLNALLVAIALAVAAIPESLPAVITVIMASGVSRMSKQRAIIKKMHAVETLGSCQIICSDKTGTLTQNKMTLTAIYCNGRIYDQQSFSNIKSPIIDCMCLCNTCEINGTEIIGDPTESVLLRGLQDTKHDFLSIRRLNHKIGELPFDSERKMMTALCSTPIGNIAYTKGAPDVILKHCTHIFDNGKIRAFNQNDIETTAEILDSLANKGLRTLAFAYKNHTGKKLNFSCEDKLVFLGICALRDPPRETSAQAVRTCIEAGIKPIMITGDYPITAREIAKEIGIFNEGDIVLTGAELDNLDDDEYAKIIKNVTVYARVSPQHKVRIVQGWQTQDCVVAMTGDGVNDAPSIKSADIGIGMGVGGTEVTKEVADMVLTDDNFATIVGAVQEGRRTYSNIKKVIQFLLGTNCVEVLSILLITLISPALGFLSAIQILFINMVTDSLPAISLTVEPAEKDVMKHKPRPKKESLFAGIWGTMLVQIIWQTIAVIGVFYISYSMTNDNVLSTTMAFAVLSLSQIFHLINVRNSHSIFTSNPFHNKIYWLTLILGIVLNVLVISITPIANVFGLTPLSITQWLIVFGASMSIIPVIEVFKLLKKLIKNKQK